MSPAAEAGVKLDDVTRARERAGTGWAVRTAHRSMDTVISANGASSFGSQARGRACFATGAPAPVTRS